MLRSADLFEMSVDDLLGRKGKKIIILGYPFSHTKNSPFSELYWFGGSGPSTCSFTILS
jgi:hypothetical protein